MGSLFVPHFWCQQPSPHPLPQSKCRTLCAEITGVITQWLNPSSVLPTAPCWRLCHLGGWGQLRHRNQQSQISQTRLHLSNRLIPLFIVFPHQCAVKSWVRVSGNISTTLYLRSSYNQYLKGPNFTNESNFICVICSAAQPVKVVV